MDKDAFSRIPIIYSLAFHSMSYSKDDPNYCAKQFMEHLKKSGSIINKEASSSINARILKIQDQRHRRELMQACNLQLTIEAVEELFPSLMKSKQIKRDDIDQILKEVAHHKLSQ